MTLAFYMDHHVPKAITNGLRARDIEVITAREDGADQFTDSELLDRATTLKRVLFTHDDDLLKEAAKRTENNILFYGVIYAHQMRVSIGACIHDLEMIAKVGEMEDMINQVQFLPL
jgi:predicted nuclease of predicted toxin-antitoxin system